MPRSARRVYPFGMRLLLALSLISAACGGGPSTEECSKNLDHLIELEILSAGGNKGLTEEMKADLQKQKESVSETQRAHYMEACVKKTPKELVDCTMRATTLEQAKKCDGN